MTNHYTLVEQFDRYVIMKNNQHAVWIVQKRNDDHEVPFYQTSLNEAVNMCNRLNNGLPIV